MPIQWSLRKCIRKVKFYITSNSSVLCARNTCHQYSKLHISLRLRIKITEIILAKWHLDRNRQKSSNENVQFADARTKMTVYLARLCTPKRSPHIPIVCYSVQCKSTKLALHWMPKTMAFVESPHDSYVPKEAAQRNSLVASLIFQYFDFEHINYFSFSSLLLPQPRYATIAKPKEHTLVVVSTLELILSWNSVPRNTMSIVELSRVHRSVWAKVEVPSLSASIIVIQ